jgi:hypothetical protein
MHFCIKVLANMFEISYLLNNTDANILGFFVFMYTRTGIT